MESGTDVVGREEEVAALVDFLDARARLPGVLLLEGEAGIGKTTLWRHGVELAAEPGYRVLSCSGSSSEARLSFVALGDLLGDALQEVLPALPAPQAKGLAVALLVEEAEGSSQDQRAIALALVGALRLLARSQPVAVAIDDVQWLDRPSAFVLEFALRRLRGEAVAFLLTRRQEEGARCGRDSSRNIKANGPTIYAHEVYVLTGAARRASYTVTNHFFVEDRNCSDPANDFPTDTAQLRTNRAGNGRADVFFVPADVAGFEGVHGVLWTVQNADREVVYRTGCSTVTLD